MAKAGNLQRFAPQTAHSTPATAARAQRRIKSCRVQQRGVPAFLSGGAVRDVLCGTVPSDFDVAAAMGTADLVRLFAPAAFQSRNALGTVVVATWMSASLATTRCSGAPGPSSRWCRFRA